MDTGRKKEPVNLKIGQLKLSCLRDGNKRIMKNEQSSWDLGGYHISVSTCTMEFKKREKKEKTISRNNGWKLPERDKRHESTQLRSSTSSRKDQCEEIHTKTCNNQITGSQWQGENLEAAREKQLVTHKRSSMWFTENFL